MILFRSDKAYGNAGHTPAEILAYETINLGNAWILSDLRKEYDEYLTKSVKNDIDWLLSAIEAGIVKVDDEAIDYRVYLEVFEGLVKAIGLAHNIKVKHLLWLTEMDNLLELYYGEECIDYIHDIDAYHTGIELVHIECDGHLFAYEAEPVSLGKSYVQATLDGTKGVYKVFVWPGVGYSLQPIYFNHCNVCLDEIAEYCVRNNTGWVLSEEEYAKEFGTLEDERFVYVDLSEKGLDNCWLCIENMTHDEGVDIYS